MRILAAIGDVQDPATWSGTGYYFLQAGRRHGFLDDGWRLDPGRLKRRRLLWNMLELARTRRAGGFQYSRSFLRRLLKQAPALSSDDEIISHFPLFPPFDQCDARLSLYIDATLMQLFGDYGFARIVSPRVRMEALARECQQYAAAYRVVCMAQWTAESVVNDYGIPRQKVHVIPGGANIDENRLTQLQWNPGPSLDAVRIGFIGKDWRRKNLPFLLEIAESLERRGRAAQVWAAGFDETSAPRHRLLRPVGFIDKRLQLQQFIQFVQSMHFGALFSYADAAPRSNLEFVRLGVPVITHDVGGMADTVPPEAGVVFPSGTSANEVADRILEFVTKASAYDALRWAAWRCAPQVTWDSHVSRFLDVWGLRRAADANECLEEPF